VHIFFAVFFASLFFALHSPLFQLVQSHKGAIGNTFGLALAGSIGESDFNGDFDFGLLNKANVSHILALTFFSTEFAFA